MKEEEETESEVDFDTNIKQMAEGFQKNEEKIQKMKAKMAEPGSPKIGPTVRLANCSAMGGGGGPSSLAQYATKKGG